MATIRRRNGKYQVQVRVQGCAPLSKTYSRLEDAKAWAQLTEVEAEQIGLPRRSPHRRNPIPSTL